MPLLLASIEEVRAFLTAQHTVARALVVSLTVSGFAGHKEPKTLTIILPLTQN